MKKSVKILLHAGFWMFFPVAVIISTWSGEFGAFSNMTGEKTVSFWSVFSDSFRFLMEPADMGAYFLSGSNLWSIIFNFYLYIALPVGVFYAYYFLFRSRHGKARLIKAIIIALVPLIITTIFKYLTIRVGFDYPYFLTLTYVYAIPFSFFGIMFRKVETWISDEKRVKENLQSELALLKNQVSPHFLFNTLNNIDSLMKSNVNKASETLIRLSELLRYMIYETNAEKMLLSVEIRQIENYIGLQKIQHTNTELLSFSVQGNPGDILLAPMLFMPFVENAFKHCTDKSKKEAIRISFTVDADQVIFECSNIYDKTQKISRDHASGAGLNNVKRRLELLYPGKHSLIISEENNEFKVHLSVMTHEH